MLTSLAAVAAVPAVAQSNDTYAFCYADPPTYRAGNFVFTPVRMVGTGAIDLGEVGAALSETAPQVRGRPVSCWRYPDQQSAESRRQAGMAHERSRGYTVMESSWTPSRISNAPVMEPSEVANPAAPTIVATPVAEAAPAAPATPPAPGAEVAADIAKAIAAPAAVAAAPAPPPEPVDDQTGAVANLNAGIVAAEAARLNAAAQVQADYQRQLDEHRRKVAEVEARNAKAQADYQAAVKACAAGDFSKCGGPPVPIRKQ
ncbi:hypothetical protein [Sphingoaurantiacus capsulatus]